MANLFPSIPAATTPTRLVSLQTIAYFQALRIQALSYMMPSKPLAAKASLVNSNFVDDVALTVATEPDFTEDGFNNDFFKMLFLYGDIVGLEDFFRTSPAGGVSAKEMSSTKLRAAPAPPAPAAPAPTAGENGARPTDEPPTLSASEGAEAGAGDPAPEEGALRSTVNSKPGRRRSEKQSLHQLIKIIVRAM